VLKDDIGILMVCYEIFSGILADEKSRWLRYRASKEGCQAFLLIFVLHSTSDFIILKLFMTIFV